MRQAGSTGGGPTVPLVTKGYTVASIDYRLSRPPAYCPIPSQNLHAFFAAPLGPFQASKPPLYARRRNASCGSWGPRNDVLPCSKATAKKRPGR